MRVHLVDGTYELFRSHFSPFPDRSDPSGRPVKATVGLVGSLLNLLHDPVEAVTHVAVAFDNPIRSFRNDLFPGYKDETNVPPELLAQFDLAEAATAAIGMVVWSMDRYEADDALATAAARFAPAVEQVRILTPDKDLGQCVRGDHVVQVDRRSKFQRTFDEEGVHDKLGVAPPSVPDYLALVGDTADGIPGLPGFGAKTAALVLDRYGHLEDIPANGLHWHPQVRGPAKLAATLRSRWDDALLYRHLATLALDVPLEHELDDLAWAGVPRDAFASWCEQLGVTGLRSRPTRWAG